jgi:hypothetical protein
MATARRTMGASQRPGAELLGASVRDVSLVSLGETTQTIGSR